VRVLDASVIVKCFLLEDDSDAARAMVASGSPWIAPDLLLLEVASVALKALRRGLIERPLAEAMVSDAPKLLHAITPVREIADAALRIAIDTGVSAYDAAYLALAELRATSLVTADARLVARAESAGLGHLVRDLRTA
jgi:predicted nucleic acid-binding protein